MEHLQSMGPAPDRSPATMANQGSSQFILESDSLDAVNIMLPPPYSLPREALGLAMANEAYLTARKHLESSQTSEYNIHEYTHESVLTLMVLMKASADTS